jgi:hypothetical protein
MPKTTAHNDLERRILELEALRPSLPPGDTLGAYGLVLMVAAATGLRGSDRSVASCADALAEILAADDVPAAILSAGKQTRRMLRRLVEDPN